MYKDKEYLSFEELHYEVATIVEQSNKIGLQLSQKKTLSQLNRNAIYRELINVQIRNAHILELLSHP